MALRTKTIEYAFPTDETLRATGTRVDYAAITLDIPENTSRTFRSVIVQVTAREAATVASVTAVLIGIKLGAVAFNDVTLTDTFTSTGEQQTWMFTRINDGANGTATYFNTNFGAGTSQTCQVGVTLTGPSRINTTVKLIITYEWDDASQTTRVKTVRIPIESNTGNLTTTLASIGSNQIPLLDEFCPEAVKSFKNIFFEVMGNEAGTAVTDASLNLALDAESADADGLHENAANSAVWYYYIWVRNSMTTSATHDLKASTTVSTTVLMNMMCAVLVVTYTYTVCPNTVLNEDLDASETGVDVVDGSVYPAVPFTVQIDSEKMRVTARATNTLTVTRGFEGTTAATHTTGATVYAVILNSLMLPFVQHAAGMFGGSIEADQDRLTGDVWIEEPVTPFLRQSGILFSFNEAADMTGPIIGSGAQANRTYVHDVGTLNCGQHTLMHRVDSGGAQGAGMTIARGKNEWTVDIYRTSTADNTTGSNLTAMLYLNYTSGLHANGDAVHNHTTHWIIEETDQDANPRVFDVIAPNIPEASYYIGGLGFAVTLMATPTSGQDAIVLSCERTSGEGSGDGWEDIYASYISAGAELGLSRMYMAEEEHFKRYPEEPGSRLAIETARNYRLEFMSALPNGWCDLTMILTYHAITFPIAGDITGSAGGTVQIKAYLKESESEETLIGTTSRSGNGAFSIMWYDDTIAKACRARESATKVGASDEGTS